MSKPGSSTTRCATCSHQRFEHVARSARSGKGRAMCAHSGCICPGFVTVTTAKVTARASKRRSRDSTQLSFGDLEGGR